MNNVIEYKIEVIMSGANEFFWCVLERHSQLDGWTNAGYGWGENSEDAWEQAVKYYQDIVIERSKNNEN